MKLNAVVVDDELPALEEMEELLGMSDLVGSVAAYRNAREAFDAIVEGRPHVAFLDIQMPGMDGLQMAEKLQLAAPETEVVFVTAYEQYALKAFDLAAVDYLLKPVYPDRLQVTLARVHRRKLEAADRPLHGQDGGASAAAGVRLRCFGRLILEGAAGPVRWKTAKVEEMFVYLFLHKEVSMERIMNDLFPGSEYDRARTYIHTCIYQIRKSLASASLSDRITIQFDRGTYKLSAVDMDSDLQQFEEGLKETAAGLSDPQKLQDVASLYIGELFEGCGGLWATERREYYRQQYIRLMLELLGRAAAAGDDGKALGYARRLQAVDPLNESLALRLIGLYLHMGHAREAKEFLERFQADYRNELGLPLPMRMTKQYGELLK